MREEKRMEINTTSANGIVINSGENEIAIAVRKENSNSPIMKEIWVRCPAKVILNNIVRR